MIHSQKCNEIDSLLTFIKWTGSPGDSVMTTSISFVDMSHHKDSKIKHDMPPTINFQHSKSERDRQQRQCATVELLKRQSRDVNEANILGNCYARCAKGPAYVAPD